MSNHTQATKRARPLKVGLILPQWNGAMEGETPKWTDMLAFAQRAEEVGFDSLWISDELLLRFEGGETIGMWECWSLLAALATMTRRIQLGPLVTCTNYRAPSLLAKIATTIDEISAGRLILGVGAGGDKGGHVSFGFSWEQRYSRFEEALQILHNLLQQGRSDFRGQHFQLQDCEILPAGPRPAGPPLLIGTLAKPGPRLLRLTAQYAQIWNGWLAFEPQPLEVVPALNRSLDAACIEAQRNPASLERTVAIGVALQGKRLKAGPQDITEGALKGSPQEIAQGLHWLAQQGISHAQILLAPHTPAGIEAFAPILDCLDAMS